MCVLYSVTAKFHLMPYRLQLLKVSVQFMLVLSTFQVQLQLISSNYMKYWTWLFKRLSTCVEVHLGGQTGL